jgi:hypothetical protein
LELLPCPPQCELPDLFPRGEGVSSSGRTPLTGFWRSTGIEESGSLTQVGVAAKVPNVAWLALSRRVRLFGI